jgi:hypothetical protein
MPQRRPNDLATRYDYTLTDSLGSRNPADDQIGAPAQRAQLDRRRHNFDLDRVVALAENPTSPAKTGDTSPQGPHPPARSHIAAGRAGGHAGYRLPFDRTAE